MCAVGYLWTREGWPNLAVMIDLFSGRVVGWSLASHRHEQLVTHVLNVPSRIRFVVSGYRLVRWHCGYYSSVDVGARRQITPGARNTFGS